MDDFNYEIDVGGRRREIARKGNQKRREEIIRGREKSAKLFDSDFFGLRKMR